jgi:hypothetical protein
METEQPCPYCKRIHYSIYTVERCAARHQVSGALTNYLIEQREKRQRQKPLNTGKKIEPLEPFKELQNRLNF